MDMSFIHNNDPFTELEDNDVYTPESPSGSPIYNDTKITSSSPKRSGRRAVKKRVVSVPIKDMEGSRTFKGETTPPSDSWAWRKYGQKPIKGSPYPRGYYRCSSSKGCPARKQVERNRVDPTTLVVTYSSEHNHPWPPPSRNNHHSAVLNKTRKLDVSTPPPDPQEKFTQLVAGDESLMNNDDEFSWFGEMQTTSSTILDSPIFSSKGISGDGNMELFFPMGEEEEALFADLGELPECSTVFRHRNVGPQVEIF